MPVSCADCIWSSHQNVIIKKTSSTQVNMVQPLFRAFLHLLDSRSIHLVKNGFKFKNSPFKKSLKTVLSKNVFLIKSLLYCQNCSKKTYWTRLILIFSFLKNIQKENLMILKYNLICRREPSSWRL